MRSPWTLSFPRLNSPNSLTLSPEKRFFSPLCILMASSRLTPTEPHFKSQGSGKKNKWKPDLQRDFFHLILDIVGSSRQEIKRWRIDDRFYLPAWKPSPQAEHSLKPLSYWLQPPTLMVRPISPKKRPNSERKKPISPSPQAF